MNMKFQRKLFLLIPFNIVMLYSLLIVYIKYNLWWFIFSSILYIFSFSAMDFYLSKKIIKGDMNENKKEEL